MKKTKSRRGYTHRDKSFWAELLGDQAGSGQSVKHYCQSRGVSASSFYRWQKLLASACSTEFTPRSVPSSGFDSIEIDPGPSPVVLVELPGGIRVHFANQPGAEYLYRLSEYFQNGAGC